MKFGFWRFFLLIIMTSVLLVGTLSLAAIIGFSFGFTNSNNMRDLLQDREAAVPTQILDRNGKLISELVGEQKRTIIYFHELPIETVSALISREDPNFFYHSGFSLKSTMRAIVFLGKRGGGSTISQQTAGVKFCDRREISITRKIKELWYSFNLERDLSKEEIIQLYLNEVYFGHSAYGIEAASQFFFGHSATELTLAESAIIVTPVSNPHYYSPLRYPDTAKKRQGFVLSKMVELNYVSQDVADKAQEEFWNNFDRNRSPDENYHDISGSNNKAPYFTDYVRSQLQNILTGTADLYKDGYIIETSLDLDYQQYAEEAAEIGLNYAQSILETTSNNDQGNISRRYIPILDLLCYATNTPGIDNYTARQNRRAEDNYVDKYSSLISLLSLTAGNEMLQETSKQTTLLKNKNDIRTEVQTSFITIDNNTGRILAMIGGREYDNQFESAVFNRSTMGKITPGSSIKPLYYSAAISDRIITAATELDDSPIIFHQKGADPYQPNNYMDLWRGPTLVRQALKVSLNIPAIQVLDWVGYDSAITRMTDLLGLQSQKNNTTLWPRKLPIALGTMQVSPLNMARAYATFANKGVATEPHGIMAIKDRNGNLVSNYGNYGYQIEEEVSQNRDEYRIMRPDEAFIIQDILVSTCADPGGFLYWRSKNYDNYDGMPMGAKTGTTQNWEDAWAVGSSPYMTTAVWYGFDEGNQSFGPQGTGASLAGRVWTNFMYNAHKELPVIEFYKPETGIVEKQICARTGYNARSSCPRVFTEYFLEGTEPTSFCQLCAGESERIHAERNKIDFLQKLEITSATVGVQDELHFPSLDDLVNDAVMDNPNRFENLSNVNNPTDQSQPTDNTIIDLDDSENQFW